MKPKLDLFIGPCVIEDRSMAMNIAETLVNKLEFCKESVNLAFKGSFDKANRTSVDSFRGVGIEEGLSILKEVREKFGIAVLTDYHLPDQAEQVAEAVDIMQVPAFLCRQTDMIVAGAKACAKYGRILNIKKGQFLSPEETKHIVGKASTFLSKDKILLTERGSSFGYNNLVVDMASFQIMKSFGVRVVHDATHCVQRPGGLGSATGGKREQIVTLAKAAVAAGADGVFIEAHHNPEKALSDAATCLPLEQVDQLIVQLLKIYEVV